MTEPDNLTTPPGPAGFPDAGKRAGLAAGPPRGLPGGAARLRRHRAAPGPAELEQTARRHGITAGQALATLVAADVLGLNDHGRVRMAYPFSAAPTPHVVAIGGGPRVHAMCAIDALGIPAMLRADAVITSSDPFTDEPVTVTFRGAAASWDPPGAVVFDGCTGCDGPVEQVSCGYLNFFAAPASARTWAGQHPEVNGHA